MNELLTLAFLLPAGVIACFPLVVIGKQAADEVLSPPRESAYKGTKHEMVFPEYEHQLYMEKLKKRRLRRQRIHKIFQR